jgi:hypothetical protein
VKKDFKKVYLVEEFYKLMLNKNPEHKYKLTIANWKEALCGVICTCYEEKKKDDK